MTEKPVSKDGVFDNSMYIIDWTEQYDRGGVITRVRHRDVAQSCIDSDGQITWMVTGQEWHSVYHDENRVCVLAQIDTVNLQIRKVYKSTNGGPNPTDNAATNEEHEKCENGKT